MQTLGPLATFLYKAVKWVVAALLLYIGVTEDIPTFLAQQLPLLKTIGGETLIRIGAILLAFVVALIALGPERVETSARWAAARWPGQSYDYSFRTPVNSHSIDHVANRLAAIGMAHEQLTDGINP